MGKPVNSAYLESYCIERASGKDPSRAFRDSKYATDKMTSGCIKSDAQKKEIRPDVIARIAELRGPAMERVQEIINTSREGQYIRIQEAWDLADNTKDKMLVICELNKMEGYHAPKKVEKKEVDEFSDSSDAELDKQIKDGYKKLNGKAL